MTELIRDVRIAIRTLLAARGFTGAAVLTLGLGLALSAAALIVVNAYLLSSLPYPGASRLYWVRYSEPGVPPPQNLADLDWSSLDHLIEHPIAWDLDMFYLVGGSYPESAPGAWVTPGFMDGFGVRPALGRGFDASAFVPAARKSRSSATGCGRHASAAMRRSSAGSSKRTSAIDPTRPRRSRS